MKIKLDQNLGERGKAALVSAGHDVCTAGMQGLGTASDEQIWRRCAMEGRVLVTLDLDFADVLRFPPAGKPGVAVLRIPEHRGTKILSTTIDTLIRALAQEDIRGHLWVIEPGRLRVHQPNVAE